MTKTPCNGFVDFWLYSARKLYNSLKELAILCLTGLVAQRAEEQLSGVTS